MCRTSSAFRYRVYRPSDGKIVDVDFTRLLPEKQLNKMSKVEFKCYVKALKSRQEPLESYEISFLKRIDKRIRNKETVRKSKKRFKEDFVSEQKKFNDLLKQYRDTVQTTYELARILKDDHKEVIQIEKVLIEKKSVWPFSDM